MLGNKEERQAGFTVLELLVSIGLLSIIMAGAAVFFSDNYRRTHDSETVLETTSTAQRIAQLLTYEFRMIGTGVPFGQSNFSITSGGLGDAPLPFLTSSTSTSLSVRFSEYGVTSTLAADFDPTSSLSLSLSNTDDLATGDIVYISNFTTGGTQGFKGEISGIVGNTVSLDASYTASVGAIFPANSILYRVSEVTYSSPGGGVGILRSDGINTLTLDPNSTLNFTYLDALGNTLTPSLTTTDIANSLSAIRFTLVTTSTIPLKDGSNYQKTITKTINIRNLNLIRA